MTLLHQTDGHCKRCHNIFGEIEYLKHRLWDCPCNQSRLRSLQRQLGIAQDVRTILPTCFLRCGAVPADFVLLNATQICAVLDYMWWAAADATQFMALAYRGKPPPDTFAPPDEYIPLSLTRIFHGMPPIARIARRTREPSAPLAELNDVAPLSDGWCIFTDGSYTPADAQNIALSGWGIVVIPPGGGPHLTFFGPCCVDSNSPHWLGGRYHSNNVAELCGIHFACRFLREQIPFGAKVLVAFDSLYAARTSLQRWRARSNTRLVANCISSVDHTIRNYHASWAWVKGHSNNHWNDLADAAAKLGASGQSQFW